MRKIKTIMFAVLSVIIIMSVCGCGKVSSPAVYEGSGYPHSYPRY